MEEKCSVWWKIYFYIIILINILLLGAFIIDGDFLGIFLLENIFGTIYMIFIFILYLISIVGFYCFIYIKRLFFKEFWQYLFFILLIDFIGDSILNFNSMINNIETKWDIVFWIILIIMTFFYFLALYKYAFKLSDSFWRQDER